MQPRTHAAPAAPRHPRPQLHSRTGHPTLCQPTHIHAGFVRQLLQVLLELLHILLRQAGNDVAIGRALAGLIAARLALLLPSSHVQAKGGQRAVLAGLGRRFKLVAHPADGLGVTGWRLEGWRKLVAAHPVGVRLLGNDFTGLAAAFLALCGLDFAALHARDQLSLLLGFDHIHSNLGLLGCRLAEAKGHGGLRIRLGHGEPGGRRREHHKE
jgi:hypothetical protein